MNKQTQEQRIAEANEEMLMKNPDIKFRWTAENISRFVSDRETEMLMDNKYNKNQ